MIAATLVGIIFIPALFALFESIKEYFYPTKDEKAPKTICRQRKRICRQQRRKQMRKYPVLLLSVLLGACHVGEEYHHTEIVTPYDVQKI